MSFRGNSSMGRTNTMAEEQKEMQGLNDRLANYMDKMKHLKQMAGNMEPSKYHEAMRQLEDELKKLRSMYEAELDRLRRKLEEANRDRTALSNSNQQYKQENADLQNKLAELSSQNRKLADEVDRLQRCLADKSREAAESKAKADALSRELDNIKPGYLKNNRDVEEMRKRLAEENQKRKEAEEKIKQMEDKLKFDRQKHTQEQKDANDRLRTANDIIKSLEDKLRNNQGNDTAQMMKKLRDANAAEMAKFQKETEDALNKNLNALKRQIDEDAKEKEKLQRDRARLEDAVRALTQKVGELDGQNQALRQQLGQLQKELADTKGRERDLEDKVRELQNLLMDKTKEYNQEREAKATLKAEIDMYRQLLDGHKDASRPATQMSRPATQTNNLRASHPGGRPTEYYDRYCRDTGKVGGSKLPTIHQTH